MNAGPLPLSEKLRDVSGAKRTRQIFIVRAVRSRPSLGSFKARTCPLIIRESCLERELFANSYAWQLDRARMQGCLVFSDGGRERRTLTS